MTQITGTSTEDGKSKGDGKQWNQQEQDYNGVSVGGMKRTRVEGSPGSQSHTGERHGHTYLIAQSG